MPAIQSGCFVRALNAHGQDVLPIADYFGHIEGKRIEITGMVPKELAVQVHISEIIHTVKMEGGKLPALVEMEFMAEPDDTVMIQPAQEPVARDGHYFPGRIIVSRFGEFGIIFSAVAPVAVQIVDDKNLLL
jgi:hypothetical protein